MPVENGTATGHAIGGLRAITCLQGLEIYLSTNGKMQITRIATPAMLRQIATEFTGKTYARSRKGLLRAYQDMVTLVKGKDLDEIGQVREVNRIAGGVAADLAHGD